MKTATKSTRNEGDTEAACGIAPRPETGSASHCVPGGTESAPTVPTVTSQIGDSNSDATTKAACGMTSCPNTGVVSQCASGGVESAPQVSKAIDISKPAGDQLSDDFTTKAASDIPSIPETGRDSQCAPGEGESAPRRNVSANSVLDTGMSPQCSPRRASQHASREPESQRPPLPSHFRRCLSGLPYERQDPPATTRLVKTLVVLCVLSILLGFGGIIINILLIAKKGVFK
ncbi:hypothetical protein TWF694_010365 [Orbilia ellipsospora]|uniref:Uncharacterized protein n=1 Tax=Orbilia ellipsospora TaxID=2528407 RepID=A0AAV9XCC1_9PEZI